VWQFLLGRLRHSHEYRSEYEPGTATGTILIARIETFVPIHASSASDPLGWDNHWLLGLPEAASSPDVGGDPVCARRCEVPEAILNQRQTEWVDAL
jgi:hypothetical protein